MTKVTPHARRGGFSRDRRLRILLIAYEFPPSPSPQSLRWAYLTNRLAALGHEVHVLAPQIGGTAEGLPHPGPAVRVYRVSPGPVQAWLNWLAARRLRGSRRPYSGTSSSPPPGLAAAVDPPHLNWKGRLLERLQGGLSWFLFPDLRAEWRRPASKALHHLLRELRPDVVVSSHEPATTLELGREAKRMGFRWVADLGDPVLAAYTPIRWKNRSAALEAAVMREADHVVVTAAQAKKLLRARHRRCAPITLVTQGFDEAFVGPCASLASHEVQLELLYSGRFYAFRDPLALVQAVLSTSGVRLNIASGSVPASVASIAKEHPRKIRLLGRVTHERALSLQRGADVLVNIANADPSQVPGKFYEYLGAARPILQLERPNCPDVTSHLMVRLRRGWVCSNEHDQVSLLLARLVRAKQEGALARDIDLDPSLVQPWSWSACAEVVADVLQDAVGSEK